MESGGLVPGQLVFASPLSSASASSLSTPNGRPVLADATAGRVFALAFLVQAIFIVELFHGIHYQASLSTTTTDKLANML